MNALLSSLTLLIFSPVIALAQASAPKPLPTPAQPDAIYLYGTPNTDSLPEQWEVLGGVRIIRNIKYPTLTPVLPDPSKATGAAVIIAPGGGFMLLAIDKEGFDIAHWFADRGIAAFVLKYRVEETPRDPSKFITYLEQKMTGFMTEIRAGRFQPQTPQYVQDDARAAVKLVREHAKDWKVDEHRIGIVGFSAGALLAVSNAVGTDASGRADFIGSLYGQLVVKPVPADAPPMFAAMASNDPLSGQGGFDFITAWQKAGRSIELHLYASGGHGFGMLKQGTTSDLWPEQFYAWMKSMGFIK